MKKAVRFLGYGLSVMVPVMVAGVFGILLAMKSAMSNAPTAIASAVVPRTPPNYDHRKPTVALLLGNTQSEITDVLGPYAIFAESGAYNVYTVASSRSLRSLTNRLDVMPHFSFTELAAVLHGSPDIVVVPAMTDVHSPENAPMLDWLRRQGNGRTLLFSWCTGAGVLAATGLLDGKAATAHWGDIDGLASEYPKVHWQRGMRYIDSGTLLTTGGLTSGIDATLHLLKRRNGEALANRVALALHYPGSPFLDSPEMPQYHFRPADSIILLNLAFEWPKRRSGVWIYDGIGELDLAALFDVHAASGTNAAYTVASTPSVTSRHGLQIVPRWQTGSLPAMDRLLVPGGDGVDQAARSIPPGMGGINVPITVLQSERSPEYPFKAALEDYARHHDLLSAEFAARRLEYRSGRVDLAGPKWPVHLLVVPLIAGFSGLGVVLLVGRMIGRRRPMSETGE